MPEDSGPRGVVRNQAVATAINSMLVFAICRGVSVATAHGVAVSV